MAASLPPDETPDNPLFAMVGPLSDQFVNHETRGVIPASKYIFERTAARQIREGKREIHRNNEEGHWMTHAVNDVWEHINTQVGCEAQFLSGNRRCP